MNIIIVGCGKIGSTILGSLASENHDIVAVDTDPKVISEISNLHDVMCLCGNGVDWETLTEAGAEKGAIEKEEQEPQLLIYLTDGYGDIPKKPPYPVLWVITPGGIDSVQWGSVARMD